MEDNEIINLWRSYGQKLEENLQLNRKNAEDITRLKVKSFLASMKPLKIFTIAAGIIWVGAIDLMIIKAFPAANWFFIISAGIQVLLTKLAIIIYLYQLILIYKADISEPVLETQHKLARLKSTTILVTRILFLQLPVWTTFYWNKSMLENGNMALYLIQIVITLSFTLVAIWLFRNIKYENKDKKWFRLIFDGKEWTPVLKSIELLNQVKEYKTDNAN
ncbi:hypothetical protein FAM09_17050 [Niastella caeni]|uniref:Uncharacterized protein n=1 Tax=Niastella caeni TaxID=2569763 RepID=A0A4S8HTM0_9BACT|nr:hypothetical protein [Niastella caeni]THU38381.1 hypothetical protein FAM09_17050 [Niastella caeni]